MVVRSTRCPSGGRRYSPDKSGGLRSNANNKVGYDDEGDGGCLIVLLIGEVFVSEFGREQLDGAPDQHNESPETDGEFDGEKFDG